MVHAPPHLSSQLQTAGVETAAAGDCVEMETLADDDDVDAVEDNHKKAHSDEHPLDGSALCSPVQDTQLGPCSSYDWSW